MGTISSKVHKEMEGKEVNAIQDCLGVPTILRRILEQFSNMQLIQLSLVNKLWNFEARSVMKKRGTLIANTSTGVVDEYNPCQKIEAFVTDLEKMPVVPFSGISIDMFHRSACRSTSDGSLDSSYDVILKRLKWKYLEVKSCEECESCSAHMLVQKILADSCGVLEELCVKYGRENFCQSIFQDCRFPRLKILKLEPGDFDTRNEPLPGAFMRVLVSRAPHLQELRVYGHINLQENILQGSSAVLVLIRPFCPLFDHVCEDLISSLRVKTMELFIQTEEILSDLLITLVPMILTASRTTLQTLAIDLSCFFRLLSYGICLENVTNLQIYMNDSTRDNPDSTAISEIPVGLGFARVFPKLNQGLVTDYYYGGRRYLLLKYFRSIVP